MDPEIEIPANPIHDENLNISTFTSSSFSPIKFTNHTEKSSSSADFRIIDEEINFKEGMAGKSIVKADDQVIEDQDTNDHQIGSQRRSDDDICNTPKRERNQDQSQNTRFTRFTENAMVKSLSMEFEQRLASINTTRNVNTTNNSYIHPNHNTPKPAQRSMSPIRSVPQLSPASRINLNNGGDEVNDDNKYTNNNSIDNDNISTDIIIETPKLVSPSKIVSAAADVEKIKRELEFKWKEQVEFLQFEVSSLEEKYEISMKSNTEMRTMLEEYEKTLAQFIDARRTRPDQHSSLDQLLQDKKKLELDLQTIQISYQNLHQRYEEMKGLQEQSRINDATLRQSIQLLQQELATTARTLENTRRAYEDKLEKMNVESKNVKESLEYELSATKAKLLKSELKISSLESAIEAKTRENSELMTICDELIHKMDKRGS